ncbi:MAG: ABC transporter permease [Actinobacteria bacterium]|nr:ABC transporter permease [Actinomycetota bacterium]
MTTSSIGFGGVAASLVLVAVAVAISLRYRLGMERTIVWACARGFVQLLAIGSALGLVLADDAPLIWAFGWVAAMVAIGGVVIQRRVPTVANMTSAGCLALGLAGGAGLTVLFALGVFPLEPRAIVPTSGMIFGNAITASVSAARRTLLEVENNRMAIEARLSLGQPGPVAVRPQVSEAIRTALTPQVETIKILGLISLPGAMTGLLLAGVDPMDAVLVQLAMMFVILGGASITSATLSLAVARRLLTRDHRLVLPETPAA